jgi:hypothetical protein
MVTITLKRIPGGGVDTPDPCFKAYKDGLLIHTEQITSRGDVKPAFLRVQTSLGVTFYKATGRRDQDKRLVWTTDVAQSKDASKSEAKPMPKAQVAKKLKGRKVVEILPAGAKAHLKDLKPAPEGLAQVAEDAVQSGDRQAANVVTDPDKAS